MILVINTEYENIYLYSKKVIDVKLIQNEIEKIKKDFVDYEIKKEKFLKDNNIDLKEHKYKLENIHYELKKYGNKNNFVLKRFEDLQKVDRKIMEYNSLNKHPKFFLKERIEKLGLEELSPQNSDVIINLSLEKNEIKTNI